MISASELDELKDRLQSLVVSDLPATFLLLKEKIPQYSPVFERVLNLEGQYNELEKKRIEKTITQESEEVSTNRIRSSVIELIAGLEVADFSRLRALGGRVLKVIGLLLGVVLIVLLFVFGLGDREPAQEEMPSTELLATIPPDKTGYLLYQVPNRMQLDRESECTVRIAYDSVKLLKEIVRSDINIETIETSEYMQVSLLNASLSNPAFDIQPIFQDQDRQFIQTEKYSEWKFSVTPLQTGRHDLTVLVTIFAEINGEYFPSKTSFKENIEILTTPVEEQVFAFKAGDELISGKSGQNLQAEVLDLRYIDYRESELNSGNAVEQSVEALSDKVRVMFPLNSATPVLTEEVTAYLQSVVGYVGNRGGKIILVGHTDNLGPTEYNKALGLRRARAIHSLLIDLGAHPAAVEVASEGETAPVASNAIPEGRQQNRRVEILVRR